MRSDVQNFISRIISSDPSLKKIEFRYTNLKDNDISALFKALEDYPESAKRIESIELSHHQLATINIPSTLVGLKRLFLTDNKTTIINIPDTLVSLEVLWVVDNPIATINLPATLVALKKLQLSRNLLKEIKIPETLVALVELFLNQNDISTIDIPDTLVALQSLGLIKNKLKDLDIPDTLVSLQEVDLSDNQIKIIKIPSTLVSLVDLDLYSNQIAMIDIPDTLVALKKLQLSRNKLAHVDIPSTLVSLQELFLAGNLIARISISSALVSLKVLGISENRLTAICIPDTLVNLGLLQAQDNELTTITIPDTLKQLGCVYLMRNQLRTVALPNTFLPGAIIGLNGNPLTLATIIALRTLIASHPDATILGLSNDIQEALTSDILQAHFEAVFYSDIQELTNSNDMRAMLRRIKMGVFSYEVIQMIIDCLAVPSVASQQQWLKDMLPEQSGIIDNYLCSKEFNGLSKNLDDQERKTRTAAQIDANKMQKLLRAHKICKGLPTGFTGKDDYEFRQGEFFHMYRLHNQSINRADLPLVDRALTSHANNPDQLVKYRRRPSMQYCNKSI